MNKFYNQLADYSNQLKNKIKQIVLSIFEIYIDENIVNLINIPQYNPKMKQLLIQLHLKIMEINIISYQNNQIRLNKLNKINKKW